MHSLLTTYFFCSGVSFCTLVTFNGIDRPSELMITYCPSVVFVTVEIIFVVYNLKFSLFKVYSPILCVDDIVNACNAVSEFSKTCPNPEKCWFRLALREFEFEFKIFSRAVIDFRFSRKGYTPAARIASINNKSSMQLLSGKLFLRNCKEIRQTHEKADNREDLWMRLKQIQR